MILLSKATRSARASFYSKGILSLPLHQLGVSFSSSSSKDEKIRSTRKWFERIVVGEKLCPFAAPLLQDPGLLRIVSSHATNEQEALVDIQQEVHHLVGLQDEPPKHETTLVVLDGHHSFVKDYLDFVRLSWTLQEQAVGERYQSKLQLVLFHPLATHQTYGAMAATDDDKDDDSLAADYTIRSPYPTIHLLREEDVLKAVQSGYPELEYLPSRNKAKLVAQGIQTCRQRLQECYDNSK